MSPVLLFSSFSLQAWAPPRMSFDLRIFDPVSMDFTSPLPVSVPLEDGTLGQLRLEVAKAIVVQRQKQKQQQEGSSSSSSSSSVTASASVASEIKDSSSFSSDGDVASELSPSEFVGMVASDAFADTVLLKLNVRTDV